MTGLSRARGSDTSTGADACLCITCSVNGPDMYEQQRQTDQTDGWYYRAVLGMHAIDACIYVHARGHPRVFKSPSTINILIQKHPYDITI